MLNSLSGRSGVARLVAAIGAGCLALAAAAPASAAGDGSVRPNYTFPAGLAGFALQSHGGVINPGVLVGFNPQPDPPGLPVTTLDLTDPFRPVMNNETIGGDWSLHFWIEGFGDGSVTPPPAPNTDGNTGFRHVLGDHVLNITFAVGPGQVDQGSWVGFDPQPDPPGLGFGVQFNFLPEVDPWAAFTITLDDTPLSFTLADFGAPSPEPATWSLLLLGFGLAGWRLRARPPSPAPAA